MNGNALKMKLKGYLKSTNAKHLILRTNKTENYTVSKQQQKSHKDIEDC